MTFKKMYLPLIGKEPKEEHWGKKKKDVLIIDKLQQLADCFLKKKHFP